MNIVICTTGQLRERCVERGYKFEEVEKCIRKIDGKKIHVDTDHRDYPRKGKRSKGVGTELTIILRRFGITSNEGGCSCKHKSKLLDTKGVKWAELNVETVVGWMKENAKKMKIPFLALPARMVVRQAIKNARRKGAKE